MRYDSLPEDYGELMARLNAFIRCPECGSERATFNVRTPHIELSEPAQVQGECPECDHKTEWVSL
jgi:endogenous inhibitor of DNA gyrase (YacG/DUF329 family)